MFDLAKDYEEVAVRTGMKGQLTGCGDLVEIEKEGGEPGEKGYVLEVVEVTFDGQKPQRVALRSLLLRSPPKDAIWNLAPLMQRKSVKVVLPASADSKSTSSKGLRAASPSGRRSDSPSGKRLQEYQEGRSASPIQESSGSPFVDAIRLLAAFPHRADKVEHLLAPPLAEFLNSTDFQYTSTSLGNGNSTGWVDWLAIFPWVLEVLSTANRQAGLSPKLTLSLEMYESLISKFDKKSGRFINNCPDTTAILPFGKFVVARLYLEQQEEVRKRLEMEAQIKELLVNECGQDGNPRISVLWSTDDDLDLRIRLPEDFGDVNFRQQCTDDSFETGDCEADDGRPAMFRPVETCSWADFDPQAIGHDAALSPPIGGYLVRLHMSGRRSVSTPCHWACQVVLGGGEPLLLGGTWNDGDAEFIEVATIAFPEPAGFGVPSCAKA